MKYIYIILVSILFAANASAQTGNVENPAGPSKKITITTDEGTWMNLDVSPDGKTIVFDLLGDIYSIPVTGGKATLLAGGKAWEIQPRFSPDGKLIAYNSDKEGGDNVWLMNADGGDKHTVTRETNNLLNNASWTPEGYLVARKNPVTSPGLSELWLYPKTGGDGIQLITGKNEQDIGEPVVTPSGKFIYWSVNINPGRDKDPNKGIFAIKRLNRETGDVETVTDGTGGACRPQISPDGKLMAFVKRVRLKTVLYLHNISTGEEWPVYDDLSHDQQETRAIFGVYPNFGWTPDNKNLIFYAKGKIWNLDVTTLNAAPIPFEVTSQQIISDALHFPQKIFQDEFNVRMVRQLTTSPDGKTIAFNAAGYIYTKTLPAGIPARITGTNNFEYSPQFSPDGKSLVYIDWSDELKSAVTKIDLITHEITRLTTEKGYYFVPRFSNKGDKIIYSKGKGNDVLGPAFSENTGIYIMPATGGAPQIITNKGTNPQFSADDSKIYYESTEGGKKLFKVMDASGSNQKTLYTSATASQFAPSSDGKWLAFNEQANCYIIPVLGTGIAQDLSTLNKIRLSRDAGINPQWSKDSQKLMWSLGPRYYARDINNAINGNNADTTGIDISLKIKTDVPDGRIAFKNARIITMKGNEVIENGTIIIDHNKIAAIGKSADVQIPTDAKIYDISGKTIMPGIIDVHARLQPSPNGVSPQQDWNYYANLVYGITTANDVSTNSETVLSQSEMLKAGYMVGPRVYSTATIPGGIDDIRTTLRGLKAMGIFSVKNYGLGTREQRQQIAAAARDLQMEVMPDGSSTFATDMTMILDGNSGIEHNIPVWPLYKDVKVLWNGSKTNYTPILVTSYGTQPGENYWYDRSEVWKNDHLLNFMPRYIVDARSRRRTTAEYGDYGHIDIAKTIKELADGGTKINIGSNGELPGLGTHWEMWMLAQGGMQPLDIIRCATINDAAYLGIDKEIGSLEVGKLADLVVMNENPLDDIRNSEKIKYVMVNGRLYDTDSMNEIGNREKPRLHFWWQMARGEMINLPDGN